MLTHGHMLSALMKTAIVTILKTGMVILVTRTTIDLLAIAIITATSKYLSCVL